VILPVDNTAIFDSWNKKLIVINNDNIDDAEFGETVQEAIELINDIKNID